MKIRKLQLAILAASLAVAMSASASITISGSDFNNPALVGSINGTYVAAPTGHMHLAFTASGAEAVVGAKGQFGTLNNLSMSFDYSNLSGTGNAPYAAFGVSDNGFWDMSGQEFLVIAMSGNQLNGTTLIHVFNVNTSANHILMSDAITLDSLLGYTYNGVAFGDMQVLRAYAYIGNWPSVGNVSVDINSITVTPVPEPTTMIAGALLLLPFGMSTVRYLRKNRKE